MKKSSGLIGFLFFFLSCSAVVLLIGCNSKKFSSNSSGVLNDPLLKYAWHISNTAQQVFASQPAVAGFDLNLSQTWSQRVYGQNIWIQISDDGLEDTHEDLLTNFTYFNKSKNYSLASPYLSTTSRPIASDDNHGTAVAGLVSAIGWNGKGSRGVAPKSRLTSANFLSGSITQTLAKYIDQADGDFDISNMSWGSTQNQIYTLDTAYNAQLKNMVTNKRNGRGTVFVKSAGNDFAVLCNGSSSSYCVGNSNFDSDNVIPYLIVVAALNAQGTSASYSSVGACVWVSSFGGEFGSDSPAMISADRSGCSSGYSKASASGTFEKGSSGENSDCNYTAKFNGTSSAAPLVSGVVALLLEVNPLLSWREIKYILAKTSTADSYNTGTINHPQSLTLPTGYAWEQKWITNGASFKYHNWYGFGRVNVDAAIALAKTSLNTSLGLGSYTETNWAHASTGLSSAIPDFDAGGVTETINVSTQLKIEAVQIKVDVTHSDISELALELTSPSGTKSILVNALNSLSGVTDFSGETFLSNAFYQENSQGNWTLRVVDAKAGNTGTLTSFSLNFFGGQ